MTIVERVNDDEYPYAVEYKTGRVIRHEKGEPVYLWETLLFRTRESARKFIELKRYGRYFEK